MAEKSSGEETPGRVDGVSIFYVLGGIPAIVAFLVLLFTLGVKGCGIAA